MVMAVIFAVKAMVVTSAKITSGSVRAFQTFGWWDYITSEFACLPRGTHLKKNALHLRGACRIEHRNHELSVVIVSGRSARVPALRGYSEVEKGQVSRVRFMCIDGL